MGLRLKIPRISQDVSTAQESVSRAGVVGQAMSSLGQGVQSLAGSVGKINKIREQREKQKRNSDVDYRSSIYKAKLRATREDIEETYKNDPDAGMSEYGKRKERLYREVSKDLKDNKSLVQLKQKTEIIDAYEDTKANNYRNLRNVKIAKDKRIESAEILSNSFMTKPPSNPADIALEIQEGVFEISQDNFTEEDRTEMSEEFAATVLDGGIEGYLSTYQFKNARKLVELIPDTKEDSLINKASLLRKINQRELYYRNMQRSKESEREKWLEGRIEREALQVEEDIRGFVNDPNYSNSESHLKLLKMGATSINKNRARSENTMNPTQVSRSKRLTRTIMEQMSETTKPAYIRKRIIDNFYAGNISAQDAETAWTSFKTRANSRFKKDQMRKSDKILREMNQTLLKTGLYDTDDEEVVRLQVIRDGIIRDYGLPPVDAAYVALNSEGKGNVQRAGTKYGYFGEMSLKAVRQAIIEVSTGSGQYKSMDIEDRERIANDYMKLETELMSNEYPTVLDLQKSKR